MASAATAEPDHQDELKIAEQSATPGSNSEDLDEHNGHTMEPQTRESETDVATSNASPVQSRASSPSSDQALSRSSASFHISDARDDLGDVATTGAAAENFPAREERNDHSSQERGSAGTYIDDDGHDTFEGFRQKAVQLCKDIGYGEPSKVERMKSGGYNKILGLTVPSRDKGELILRFPHAIGPSETNEIKDQVAVLLYLSQHEFLHVPSIAAFDTTTNNALASPYVIQEKVAGIPIQDVFYDLPLPEKLHIAGVVAKMLSKLEAIKLEEPGRLVDTGDLPDVSHATPSSVAEIKITGFRETQNPDGLSTDKQPLESFIKSLLEHRKRQGADWNEMVERCIRLQEIADEMKSAGLIRVTDDACALWHWDLSAQNIMIRKENEMPTAASGHEQGSQHIQPQQDTSNEVGVKKSSGSDMHQSHHHSAQFIVEDIAEDIAAQGTKHSVQIQLEHCQGNPCSHKVQVSIEDSRGKMYRYTLEITDSNKPGPIAQQELTSAKALGAVDSSDLANKKPTRQMQELASGIWAISGVLDWDDVLSVPLVLARKPPSWLWLNEENRGDFWTGNRDDPPERKLLRDELLVKAHFDQTMERESPGYMEDAYHRGPWLRALARFAIYGFEDSAEWNKYDGFVAAWEKYY